MKETTVSSTLFVLSGISRSQAECQIPKGNEWGIEQIYANAESYEPADRYAWAIYKKAFFPKPVNEWAHVALALQLQWMYDHAKELQVEE